MLNVFTGRRPDLTPAQIVSGIPILAELLHSFGVYSLSQAQQDSLSKTVVWGLGLLGADTVVRAARNHADAKRDAAVLNNSAEPPDAVHGGPDATAPAEAPLEPEEIEALDEELDRVGDEPELEEPPEVPDTKPGA